MKASTRSKAKITLSQTKQLIFTIIGWSIAGFGLLAMLAFCFPAKETAEKIRSGETDQIGGIIAGAVLLAAGGAMVLFSFRQRRLIKDFKNYVKIIAPDPENSIEPIAAEMNIPLETVKTNIRKMIKKGYFVNARLDDANNRLILGLGNTYDILDRKENEAIEANKPMDLVPVTCPGCGMKTAVPRGKTARCEYCGSWLQAL